jgi:hypothetical protein
MKSHPRIDAYGLKESSCCEAMEKRKLLQSIFLQVLSFNFKSFNSGSVLTWQPLTKARSHHEVKDRLGAELRKPDWFTDPI